jgi:DNA-directed RNA polymerase specialized sigma24 family protein
VQSPEADLDLVTLDAALGALEKDEPRLASVVALRIFAGMSIEETAEALELSPATVKRDWLYARAWLAEQMGGG